MGNSLELGAARAISIETRLLRDRRAIQYIALQQIISGLHKVTFSSANNYFLERILKLLIPRISNRGFRCSFYIELKIVNEHKDN